MVSARVLLAARVALIGTATALLITLGLVRPAAGSETNGTLTGTVTGGGRALPNAWVTLTPVDPWGSAAGAAQRTITDASGDYEFTGLPAGPVKVQVKAPLLAEFADTYWPAAHTFATAGVIDVPEGTATADVDLPVAGSVRGRIVDGRTGEPIQGARVTASVPDDSSSGDLGRAGPVEGPGLFTLSGLPPVTLLLAVTLPTGSPYLNPLADGSTQIDALLIDGSARTSGLDIGLRRAAEIRGTIRDDAGEPVAGADVRLTGCRTACPPPAASDAFGRYRLVPVAPGAGLGVVAAPSEELLGPWYPSRQTTARVNDLAVDEGGIVDAVDLTLPRAAYVTVEVRGLARAEPLRAIVRLTTTGRTYSQYFARTPDVTTATPLAPTRLRVGPVPPGDYALGLSVGVADAGYLPGRWVTDSGTPSTPTFRLAAGEETEAVISVEGSGDRGTGPGEEAAPTDPGGWPGLGRGFLAATTWPTLSGG